MYYIKLYHGKRWCVLQTLIFNDDINSFQNGVDKIYNKCIGTIYTDRYNTGYNKGKTDGASSAHKSGIFILEATYYQGGSGAYAMIARLYNSSGALLAEAASYTDGDLSNKVQLTITL